MLSKRVRKLDQENITVEVGEEVELEIGKRSDLGVSVIINGVHKGLLYNNEIFQPLKEGDRVKGYVKKIRADNNIDVRLQRFGYRKVPPNADKILKKLKEKGGVLHLTDKSKPESITSQLQMSKKTFKKAVGALYKQRLIRIEEDGIYLK